MRHLVCTSRYPISQGDSYPHFTEERKGLALCPEGRKWLVCPSSALWAPPLLGDSRWSCELGEVNASWRGVRWWKMKESPATTGMDTQMGRGGGVYFGRSSLGRVGGLGPEA